MRKVLLNQSVLLGTPIKKMDTVCLSPLKRAPHANVGKHWSNGLACNLEQRMTDRQTDRQAKTDRQTHKTDRQTKQTNR